MYELFEHTADLGLRAVAADLDMLFADAAMCLFTAIVEDPAAVRPAIDVAIEIAGTDREFLLFDWLKALLRCFDDEQMLFDQFEVKVRADGLSATAPAALRALIREYLSISLFRACAESLASENASRLAAMERADKNINDLLEQLHGSFHQLRQSGIDEELFDVISGFEALVGSR